MMHTDTPLAIRRAPRYVVGLFFGLLLLLGGLVFADYGVSWDEPIDRRNGLVSLRFVTGLIAPEWTESQALLHAAPSIRDYPDNDHGVLFELPIALFDVLRPGTDQRTYYLVRHAAVFLVSLLGAWALFKLATLRFRDERLGLLAAGLLVLSPRFFAESFYNGKDLAFVALFTLGIYTLARLLERPTWRRAVVHGLVTAAATDVRILGLMIAAFTFTLLALQYANEATPASRSALRRAGLVYLLALAAGVVAGWPYLWEHTLEHLAAAFASLSHFRWQGDLLYMGQVVNATKIPWHYGLVWMSITTPIAYQVAGLLGLGLVAWRLLRHPWATLRTSSGRLDFLVAGWLVAPLVLVIALHSVLYDGWRHLYFVYPALLLLAVRGAVAVGRLAQRGQAWRQLALGLGLLASAELMLTAVRMARMHPFEQTYFSYLPSRVAERSFERDYWALSYRQGLEHLVATHPKGPIYVDAAHLFQIDNNSLWLPEADRDRLVITSSQPGRYFISSYRCMGTHYSTDDMGPEVFTLHPDGITILSIFKKPLHPVPPASQPAPPGAW
jgi:hypothetical protein